MRLGILFSGGKDSCYALKLAKEREEAVCLISLISKNKESYMFHTPNICMTNLQAEAIGLPIISAATGGKEEEELKELKSAVIKAKDEFKIEGIVTGAVGSVYQSTRIERVCDESGIYCFSPLWQKDQIELLNDIVDQGFEVIISGVFAEPFDKSWLGRRLDRGVIEELGIMADKYKINPAGEGGEIETTVLYAPFFRKRIVVKESDIEFDKNSGVFNIKKAELADR